MSNPKVIITDLVALVKHYASGRPDNWDGSTKAQALTTIREAEEYLERGDATAARYSTFTRNWYRIGPNGRREGHMGPKRYHHRNLTLAEARAVCEEWNATHNPGHLSRKMEFEQQ